MKKFSVTFLAMSCLLTLVTCNQEACFRNQKYTNLKFRNTKGAFPPNINIHTSLIENQSILGLKEDDTDSEPLSLFDEVLSNTDSKKSDDPKSEETIFILKNSIRQKHPILVKCGGDKFLVADPYIDTISNKLCGNYVLIRELEEPTILEIDIDAINCSQIRDNCVDIRSIEYSVLRTNELTDTADIPISTLGEYIAEGKRVYLISGKSVYIVHEAKYDSINNNLCGRFVKIENERISPNICLEINKKGTRQISSGCIDLGTVIHVSKNHVETISKKERKNLSALSLLLILIGVIASIILSMNFNTLFSNNGGPGIWGAFSFLIVSGYVLLGIVALLLIALIIWTITSA